MRKSTAVRVQILAILSFTLFSGISFSLANLTINPERVGVVLALPLLGALWFQSVYVRDLRLAIVLSLFFLLALASAGDGWGQRYLIYAGPMVYCAVASRLKCDSAEFESGTKGFAFGFFGLSVLLYLLGPNVFPSCFEGSRFRLLLFEPNIYGAFAGYLLLVCYPFLRANWSSIVLGALGLASLTIAFSKGPFIGFALGLVFQVGSDNRLTRFRRVLAVLTAASAAAVAAWLATNSTTYQELFARQSTTDVRLELFKDGFKEFLERPLLGHGPISFGANSQDLLINLGSDNPKNLWLGQLELAYLHDFGVVGWVAVNLFLLSLIAKAMREGGAIRVALVGGFLSIYVAAQFTSTHTTGLFWAAAGMMAISLTHRIKSSKNGA